MSSNLPVQPISHTMMRTYLEHMTTALAKLFGVTLVVDNNGAHGPAGTTYLTLRWRQNGKNLEARWVLTQLRNVDYDLARGKEAGRGD